METKKVIRKTIIGTVVSNKMDKSITVRWTTRRQHPLYKKFVTVHKKVMAHDEKKEASVGDLVKVIQSRPVSRRKCWRLAGIVEKAQEGF